MNGARCAYCGRLACAALCLAMSSAAMVSSLSAQTMRVKIAPVGSTTAVSIGALFVTTPMQPMLAAAPPGSPCGGARCYRGVITVRANQRWQLQVRLDESLGLPASVAWRPPLAGNTEHILDAEWFTVLSGPIPTSGTDVALQFAVKATGGQAQGGEPFAQLVSLAVQYRVIALP